MLASLTGFESRGDIGIIGTTNHTRYLGQLVISQPRIILTDSLKFRFPNDDEENKYLKIHTKNMALDEEASWIVAV